MGRAVTLISSARLTGRTHDRCDDRFFFCRHPHWHIAALCDGAGSRPLSSEGAKLASREACRAIPGLLGECVGDAKEIRRRLQSLPMRLRMRIALRYLPALGLVSIGDFAATLLFVAHHLSSGRWIVGHIGDGVVSGMKNGEPITLSHPHNGEFANTTLFFTDHSAHENLRIGCFDDLDGVALMSDGTAKTFYRHSDGTSSGALSKLFAWQKRLGEAKGSSVLRKNLETFAIPKTGDDCSMLLMQRTGGAF